MDWVVVGLEPLTQIERDFEKASAQKNLSAMRRELQRIRRVSDSDPLFMEEAEKLKAKMIKKIASCLPRSLFLDEEHERAKQMHALPPIGIKNIRANCAFNALLQLTANTPRLLEEILISPDCIAVASVLRTYAFRQKITLTPPSEIFRQLALAWLRKEIPKAPPKELQRPLHYLCHLWSDQALPLGGSMPDEERFEALRKLWLSRAIAPSPPPESHAAFRALAFGWGGMVPVPDSQILRNQISIWTNESIPSVPEIQVDVAEVATALLQKVCENYPLLQTVEKEKGTPKKIHETLPMIDLEVRGTLIESINHFFHSLNQEGERRKVQLHNYPSTLRFNINRFGQVDKELYKISDPIEAVPTELTLAESHVIEEEGKYLASKSPPKYRLSGGVIHRGDNFARGHYVALLYKPPTFYLVDDNTPFEWKEKSWHLVEKGRQVTPEEALAHNLFITRNLSEYLTKEMLLKPGALLNHTHLMTPQDFLGQSYLLYYHHV